MSLKLDLIQLASYTNLTVLKKYIYILFGYRDEEVTEGA